MVVATVQTGKQADEKSKTKSEGEIEARRKETLFPWNTFINLGLLLEAPG